MTKAYYATFIAAVIIISATSAAYADSDFTQIKGDDIKNNPVSQDILKKIEESRKQFDKLKEIERKRIEQQKFIDEQRRLAQESLQQEISRMHDEFNDFTPRNAFAKYVSKIDESHQAIYWDQFDYIQTKIKLAKDARDKVLEAGGSYQDAMKEYRTYAKMTKIEMFNVLKNLNIKYDYAKQEVQDYFDHNSKLPRYENDLDAPCYGCTEKITKVNTNSQTILVQNTNNPAKPTLAELQNTLSDLQDKFLDTKNVISQKKIVLEMNDIVKKIQELS